MKLFDFENALTYDDILVLPGASSVLPSETILKTTLARNIELNIPILSAAMDTVTESAMAIALAREGGMGVIHKNLSPTDQAKEVAKVKRSESGIIVDPVTLDSNSTIADAVELSSSHNVSGFPVVSRGKLVGILTNRDYQFETNLSTPVQTLMTPVEDIITSPPDIELEDAKELLRVNRLEKLPLIDDEMHLLGLITMKDIHNTTTHPNACKDSSGSLRVGAAVGVGEKALERAEGLINASVDCLFIDTAHGHSSRVIDMTATLRQKYPDTAIVAGNVVTPEAVEDLVKAGADAVKVGVGPGSICTTRVIAGVGCPQATAVYQCAKAAKKLGIQIIADGGIKYSGDIVKALCVGGASVMIGSLLAGMEESPGEKIIYNGRRFKTYRGMGSIGAMKAGSADRYFQTDLDEKKLVPEGIEGMVPFKGSLVDYLVQLIGGLRQGMGYIGASVIPELPTRARVIRISVAGLKESHTHDVRITKEAPNYSRENSAF